MAKLVTGREIKTIECDRPFGDRPVFVGSSDKARKILGRQPHYPDLNDIMTHALTWDQQRHA